MTHDHHVIYSIDSVLPQGPFMTLGCPGSMLRNVGKSLVGQSKPPSLGYYGGYWQLGAGLRRVEDVR